MAEDINEQYTALTRSRKGKIIANAIIRKVRKGGGIGIRKITKGWGGGKTLKTHGRPSKQHEEVEDLDEACAVNPGNMKDRMFVDAAKKTKEGNIRLAKGFFYLHGRTSEKHADNMSKDLNSQGIKHDVVDHGTVHKDFRGGAGTWAQSHHWVDVKIHPGQSFKEEVETGLDEGKKSENPQFIEVETHLGVVTRHKVHSSRSYEALNHFRKQPATKKARIVSEEIEYLDEKAIVTKQNKDGTYDEVGMNNRTVFDGSSRSHITKKAKAWAKGTPHRIEYVNSAHEEVQSLDAYNATDLTRRMPAVENAVMDVMKKSMEMRKVFQESENLAIVSPEQRDDWINVERGQMRVTDYLNKYRIREE